MYRTIYFLFVLIWLVSCGTQRQLQKAFTGKSVSALHEKFGHPVNVIENQDDSIYIFEKTEELKSTEISQGKLTIDPIITPKVNKTERFYFTIKNGIVAESRLEEEYRR